MPNFNLPVKEILLALFSFGLGIAATLISQVIERKFAFGEKKRKSRYKNLKLVREWIEGYQEILDLEYPNLPGFWLSSVIAPSPRYKRPAEDWEGKRTGAPTERPRFEENIARDLLYHLRKYKQQKILLDRATKEGQEAFELLKEKPPLRVRLFKKRYDPAVLYYGAGFCARVLFPLRDFRKRFDYLYYQIEKDFAQLKIDWDRLDMIEANELHLVMEYAKLPVYQANYPYDEYMVMYEQLRSAIQTVRSEKNMAKRYLYDIMDIIKEYEAKWFV